MFLPPGLNRETRREGRTSWLLFLSLELLYRWTVLGVGKGADGRRLGAEEAARKIQRDFYE